jgi:hypothetical protein
VSFDVVIEERGKGDGGFRGGVLADEAQDALPVAAVQGRVAEFLQEVWVVPVESCTWPEANRTERRYKT